MNLLWLKARKSNFINFSPDEKNLIETTSELCAIFHGRGVHKARFLRSLHGSDTDYLAIDEACSVEDRSAQPNTQQLEISVSPNPTTDYLRLNLTNTSTSKQGGRVLIYDSNGSELKSVNVHTTKPSIDVSGFPEGLYLGKVIDQNNEVHLFKFIKI